MFISIFQFHFFNTRDTSSTKKLLLIILLFCFLDLNAQVKLRIEPGFLQETESENLGLLLNVEPCIDVSKNSVIGLRFGMALNP